jgi:hypothetical protein
MKLLYSLNLAFYFALYFYKLKFLSSFFENTFLNPVWISFLFVLPVEVFKVLLGPAYVLEEGLFDTYFNYAILMTNISNSINFLIMYFAFKISSFNQLKISFFSEMKLGIHSAVKISMFFYILYILFFVLLSQHSFGFVNWIKNPREGYQFHRVGAGGFWVIAISCLSVSFFTYTIFAKSIAKIFISLPFYVCSALLLGSKGVVLDFGIYFMIILWLRKYKHLRKVFLVGVPLIMTLLIFSFIINIEEGNNLEEIVKYFDYYVNSANYYKAYFQGELPLFQGKIISTQFWSFLPRALFPEKPFVYGVLHINEFLFPGAAEETHTPGLGGPVAYFGDFGIWGVVLLTLFDPFIFLNYLFLFILYKNLTLVKILNNNYLYFILMWFVAPSFLFYMYFPLNILFFIFVIISVNLISKLRVRF